MTKDGKLKIEAMEDIDSAEKGLIGVQSEYEHLHSKMKFAACQRIAEIYDKYVSSAGKISEDEIEELRSILKEFYPNAEISNYLPNFTELRENYRLNPGDNTSLFLNLPGQVQEEDFYCGPASGYAVLAYRGISVTQDQLAYNMQTTEDYGTDLYSVASALNLYNGEQDNYFFYDTLEGYVLSGETMTATEWAISFTNTAIQTLLGYYGVVYDAHQLYGSSYFLEGYDDINGVAESSIYHYIAGEGFNSTDPSSRICYYYDSNNLKNFSDRHMDVTFQVMAVLCNDRGLTY